MNWFLIVIAVVGLISSLINKANEAKPAQRRPVRRQPNSSRPEPFDSRNLQNDKPSNQRPSFLEKYESRTPSRPTFIKGEGLSGGEGRSGSEGKSGGEGMSNLITNMIEETEGVVLEQDTIKGNMNQSHPLLETDPQALIKGIVWSEILGPPRSKRPHRTIIQKKW